MRSVLLGIFFLLPALCETDQTCPWLNAATAGGVLGGDVTSAVTHSTKNKNDAICSFVRTTYDLQITVETMAAPPKDFAKYAGGCSLKPTPLKGIGNEAVACAVQAGDGQRAEQVVGRVRDRAFVIQIRTKDRAETETSLREKVRSVAEQVAGNLF